MFSSASCQTDTIRWLQQSSLPDGLQRTGSAYFLIDSDFYVAGGQAGNVSSCLSTVWKYHIPTDNWLQMRNLPFGPASCGGSFVLNGKGYFLVDGDSISNYNCDTMFWEYNPIDDSWARKAGLPDEPRNNFIYGGKGYVGQTYGCSATDTHFWQYDPISNIWTQIATLPADIAAGSVAIAAPSANAYLLGGYDIGGNFLNYVWKLNITSNQWDSIGRIPGFGRCYSSFWGFDSIIIGGGGQTSDNNLFLNLGSDFYCYNILRNIWTPVVFQNSFDSTGGGAPFVYKKRGYYFGGYTSLTPNIRYNNRMWSFDASKYIHDTTIGISEVDDAAIFKVYPNPVNSNAGFSISTSESGSILFYDALGRILNERKLARGINQIKLTTDNEVVFYKATLHNGITENGKVVLTK